MTICRKLPNTFYFGPLLCVLRFLQRYIFCLNYRVKEFVRKRCDVAKTPKWVSESIQTAWLVFGIMVLTFSSDGIRTNIWGTVIVLLITYRLIEIVVFVLNWVFVSERVEKLHSYRRSLAGFFLNVIELAVYTTIIAKYLCCWDMPSSNLEAVIANLSTILSIGGGGELPKGRLCLVFSFTKAFAAWVVIAVAIASLVGAILREEVQSPSNGQS